ncbi:MAG: hypothetical protein C4540_07085 [Candidatus Omnitrophota bacterium]|nr:MAG: hypothetical protein C4540_07085 [Candidatus Omnitrophota bacterium]
MSLRNKRVLITAGSTWVPIDRVRVISNIATGLTGILLARSLQKKGARVTLCLGNSALCPSIKTARLRRFKFFDELKDVLFEELTQRRYDIVIHSAAVSDFCPQQAVSGKLDSGRGAVLRLKPLPKLIKKIRALAPSSGLVMFKLEPAVKDSILIGRAINAMRAVRADIAVACSLDPYKAIILNGSKKRVVVKSKRELVNRLIPLLEKAEV